MKYLLGYDIGSSSVKAALLEIDSGKCVAAAQSPAEEMPMAAPQPGWAEQDPEQWWQELIMATGQLRSKIRFESSDVAAIGISYQMHGLVCVDEKQQVLRPSIIWCDSRAVPYGEAAFAVLGKDFCLQHLLNSPGNFTAAKLKWVKEQEPAVYEKIHKIMLPGDFIAMKMSGTIATTISGLSEGVFWDYERQAVSEELLRCFGFSAELIPDTVNTFGIQAHLSAQGAAALGLQKGIPITYRAGDQPNNAYSLNVLQPGEVAATAGTSGVVYGVHDRVAYDARSRVNTFVHVNHTATHTRNGVLLCVNGTGILNSWLRRQLGSPSYEQMNQWAARVGIGADGLQFYPFGNGAERILENKNLGAQLRGLHFNRHNQQHLMRAAQEGIVFALQYGLDIMRQMGLQVQKVRAGYANMFLSPLFREAFANTTGATIELYNTDGAQGAARAAGLGAGIYASFAESFQGMEPMEEVVPQSTLQQQYMAAYQQWLSNLQQLLQKFQPEIL